MAEGPTPPSAKGSNPIARLDATGIPMLVARLVLGFVFLSYGLEKVQDPVATVDFSLLPCGITHKSCVILVCFGIFCWVLYIYC